MAREVKEIKFELPLPLWEEITRLLPGYGEKTAFFRRICETAVRLAKHKDNFIHLVFEDLKEETVWKD